MSLLKPIKSKEVRLLESLFPVFVLMFLLAINIFFASGELLGTYSNQFILIFSAVIALLLGVKNKTPLIAVFKGIVKNIQSVFIPILILFLVGALAGSWLVGGVIPAMIYYGLDVLNPTIFLPASVVISALVSLATGSSWTTSATVGIALIGIGEALGVSSGMIAGAVISGAYFGDKMSPLSDTTNLAPAMAGVDLFTHIKYMSLTTVPTFIITLLFFTLLSFTTISKGTVDVVYLQSGITNTFHITPVLFLVPVAVILLLLFKVKSILSLLSGIVLACVFAFVYQKNVLLEISTSSMQSIFQAILTDVQITTTDKMLNELFSSGGMKGMLWTIYLIISAMIFGGVMEAVGALSKITNSLLKYAHSTFGIFSSTVVSCLGVNIMASDQYLAIVIPGKMFKKAYEEKGLAPENLSRTLEDSGTVTSVLIPWNTCGAYQSTVLGVSVADYFVYAVFNYVSPIVTLTYAYFSIKIKRIIS